MYQVNININAGADFKQEFFVTGPDKSPTDITGCKFHGRLGKHSKPLIAHLSTSDNPVYNFVKFDTAVSNGNGGGYTISLSSEQTSTLEEGKYFYQVVLEDVNGESSKVMSGLAFVDFSFGDN